MACLQSSGGSTKSGALPAQRKDKHGEQVSTPSSVHFQALRSVGERRPDGAEGWVWEWDELWGPQSQPEGRCQMDRHRLNNANVC